MNEAGKNNSPKRTHTHPGGIALASSLIIYKEQSQVSTKAVDSRYHQKPCTAISFPNEQSLMSIQRWSQTGRRRARASGQSWVSLTLLVAGRPGARTEPATLMRGRTLSCTGQPGPQGGLGCPPASLPGLVLLHSWGTQAQAAAEAALLGPQACWFCAGSCWPDFRLSPCRPKVGLSPQISGMLSKCVRLHLWSSRNMLNTWYCYFLKTNWRKHHLFCGCWNFLQISVCWERKVTVKLLSRHAGVRRKQHGLKS